MALPRLNAIQLHAAASIAERLGSNGFTSIAHPDMPRRVWDGVTLPVRGPVLAAASANSVVDAALAVHGSTHVGLYETRQGDGCSYRTRPCEPSRLRPIGVGLLIGLVGLHSKGRYWHRVVDPYRTAGLALPRLICYRYQTDAL